MDTTHNTRDEQAALWNGVAGCAWVDAQELLDQMYKPLEDLIVDAVITRSRRSVLDVGCGTGGTTRAVARRLGGRGRAVGIDISEPMIASARARAGQEDTPAEFIRGDAQDYPFEPERFDMIISRFGVMFFEDPVGAFANLHRAAAHDGDLRFIAWRSATDNPFMTTAERAAAPILPNLPARKPDAPGQFAFANRERVAAILEKSGWKGVEIEPTDVECRLPEKELVQHMTRFGPVGLTLQNADEETRARVIDVVRPAFDPYVHGADVRFTAACWTVSARRSPEH